MRTDQISPGAFFAGALLLLVLPLRWLIAAVFAALFHEFCHYAALRFCHGRINGFCIGSSGAVLDALPLTAGKELFCLLAGPLGGLLLLLCARWIPRVAVCAACQSVYNLLPISTLDGGRALRCGVRLALPPDRADRICRCVERICLWGLVILGGYASVVLRLGFLPLMAVLLLMIRLYGVKTSCKPCRLRVQ